MNLDEAITHAENLAPKNKGVLPGDAAYSNLIYYVSKWNGDYCVFSNSYIERHSNVEWIYNTRYKMIFIKKKDLQKAFEGSQESINFIRNCFNIQIDNIISKVPGAELDNDHRNWAFGYVIEKMEKFMPAIKNEKQYTSVMYFLIVRYLFWGTPVSKNHESVRLKFDGNEDYFI